MASIGTTENRVLQQGDDGQGYLDFGAAPVRPLQVLQQQGAATQAEAAAADVGLTGLRRASLQRQLEWDPDGRISLEFRAVELAGEVGEALNVVKKLLRERLHLPGSRASLQDLAEELADVIICADLVALHEGIDLAAAVRNKFNHTSEKLRLKVRL